MKLVSILDFQLRLAGLGGNVVPVNAKMRGAKNEGGGL